MSEIRRVVETIRSHLSSPDLTLSDSLRSAAESYAEACQRINERLTRCEELLRQGQRAEALRQAEIDPDVLEAAGDLDFAERSLWEERLILNDAPQPPLLNRHAIEMLNRAYADEAPLAELLKHHRLQALMRAPLRERVKTIRLLARAEKTNPVWGEDTFAYENARIDEMRFELRQIRQANDWPHVQVIKSEVESSEWQSVLPLELIDDINREYARLSRLDAENRLRKYGEMAALANNALDLNRCRTIRRLVEKLCKERQIHPGDPSLKSLTPFLDWLAEQDRLAKQAKQFERACAELRDAMSQGADTDVLSFLYQSACNYRLPIPNDLETAYRDQLSRIKRKQRLTTIFVVVAMVAIVAIMAGALGLVLLLS